MYLFQHSYRKCPSFHLVGVDSGLWVIDIEEHGALRAGLTLLGVSFSSAVRNGWLGSEGPWLSPFEADLGRSQVWQIWETCAGIAGRRRIHGQCRADMVLKCAPAHRMHPGWGVRHLGPFSRTAYAPAPYHACWNLRFRTLWITLPASWLDSGLTTSVPCTPWHAWGFPFWGSCLMLLFPSLRCLSGMIDRLIILSLYREFSNYLRKADVFCFILIIVP